MDKNTLKEVADWDDCPDLMECDLFENMSAENCNLEYWIKNVAQGTLKNLSNGYPPNSSIPKHMYEDGPFRTAMLKEMAFRFQCEVLATRSLTYLVSLAPNVDYMNFYVTQILDEARHADIFRTHMLELGIAAKDLDAIIQEYSKQELENILLPMEEWGLEVLRGRKDFYGGVAIITILLEGVLAPTAALSEKKWRRIDERASDLQKGANIDEIRHLNVGSTILRNYISESSDNIAAIAEVLGEGKILWSKLPVNEMIYAKETLFQQGMESHAYLLDDYELAPGLRLLDTTIESRLNLALKWSDKLQLSRMRYMGLSDLLSA